LRATAIPSEEALETAKYGQALHFPGAGDGISDFIVTRYIHAIQLIRIHYLSPLR